MSFGCFCFTSHQDIQSYCGISGAFPYPIIADLDRRIAKNLGMIDPDELDVQGMPLTCRAVCQSVTCRVEWYISL